MYRLKYIVALFWILSGLPLLQAQTVSPWFRAAQTLSFDQLRRQAFTLERVMSAQLSKPGIGPATGYAVKTNVPNWLKHKLFYSGTISKMEKNVLVHTPSTALTSVSGKLQFFYDRDQLLAQTLMPTNTLQMDKNAFIQHQHLLQTTRTEIETYGIESMAYSLSKYNSFLTEEEIKHLLQTSQPPSFILIRQEVEKFPHWSLEYQRFYAQHVVDSIQKNLKKIIEVDPQTLSEAKFEEYYLLKCRLFYFKQLTQVLNDATQPRNTIIIRQYRKLSLNFLPEPNQRLTDAQRLGKIQFYLDYYQYDVPNKSYTDILNQEVLLQRNSYVYAMAEALNIPYENVLGGKILPAAKVLDAQTIHVLENTPAPEKANQAILEMQKLSDEMALFRAQHPNPTVQDYVTYYRLFTQKEQLNVERIKARVSSRQ